MQQDAVGNRYRQAREAFARGQFMQVVRHCDQLLRGPGPRSEFLNLRGLALQAAGQPEAAEASFAAALKQAPNAAGIHLNLASTQWQQAKRKQARRHALEAARLGSGEAAVLHQAARLSRDCGDPERALQLIERGLQLHPDFAPGWHLKGSLLLDQGDTAGALVALERAVRLDPKQGRAYADIVVARGDTLADAPTVRALQAIAGAAAPAEAASALFCLAGLHDRAGEYPAALDLYHQANRRRRSTMRFDASAYDNGVERLLADIARPGLWPAADRSDGSQLLFIVGMPRTGSTVLERMLGAHSAVLACGESPVMQQLEAGLLRRGIHPLAPAAEAALGGLRQAALDNLPPAHARFAVVTDKAPMNFERLGFIHRLFPRARFVHCRRAPLDVAWSCYRQDFQAGLPWAFDLDEIGTVMRAERRLMAQWRELLPHHIHEVVHEDLLHDPREVLGALCEFLEISFEAAMLDPAQAGGTVGTASRDQVRAPLRQAPAEMPEVYRAALSGLAQRL